MERRGGIKYVPGVLQRSGSLPLGVQIVHEMGRPGGGVRRAREPAKALLAKLDNQAWAASGEAAIFILIQWRYPPAKP